MATPYDEEMLQIHNTLIVNVADHFFENIQLEQIKQMLTNHLSPRELASATTVMKIVNLLVQNRKISIGDYTFLRNKIGHLNQGFVEEYINPAENQIAAIRAKIPATLTPSQFCPKDNPMDNMYPIAEGQTGLALILNVMTKSRPGYEKDKDNLTDVFQEKLKFKTHYFENLTKDSIIKHLTMAQKWMKEENGNKYYCFVCVVMSHGGVNGILTNDGKTLIKMDEITKPFDNINLETCAGKPKIFIVQTCRGDKTQDVAPKDNAIFYEDQTTVPRDADMIIAFATKEDYSAVRDPELGSWFIYTLVDVVRDRFEKNHLEEMLVYVRQKVATLRCDYKENGKDITLSQIPCSWTTLTKLLYLKAGK